MLQLGSSKPWQDALEQLTGERKMSARPILEVTVNRDNGRSDREGAQINYYVTVIPDLLTT